MESLFESQLVAARDKVVLSSLKRVLEGDDELDKMVESGTRKCEEFIKTGRTIFELTKKIFFECSFSDSVFRNQLNVFKIIT